MISQRSDVFFILTEELTQIGFLDDVDRPSHSKILTALRGFLTQHKDIRSGEKVARLLAKFAELLDDDACVYSELTNLLFERLQLCFAKSDHPIDAKTVIFVLTTEN